jgi:hypothetical protein
LEERYRKGVARKRIEMVDLRALLEEGDGVRVRESIGGLVCRLNLRLTMLLTPIGLGEEFEMRWFVAETQALQKFRT